MSHPSLKVSEVARLAGVSVRTLHHYDERGLVCPSARSDAGYRLYAPPDLERLQQVLFFRELGFPLEEIQRIVSDPGFDVAAALRMQRRLLTERAERVRALLAAVDAAIDAREKGTPLTSEERLQVFGGFDPAQHEAEARAQWGDTDAYKESARRTKKHTSDDWKQIGAEIEALFTDLATLAQRGVPPTETAALDVAERHRAHVSRWFYPCPPALHQGLGELYVSDARFQDNIDRHHAGLAAYAREAWRANAARQAASQAASQAAKKTAR